MITESWSRDYLLQKAYYKYYLTFKLAYFIRNKPVMGKVTW